MKSWQDLIGLAKHPAALVAAVTLLWHNMATVVGGNDWAHVVTTVLVALGALVGANTKEQRSR